MILVISADDDEHAREILTRLSRKGARAELLDLSLYPIQAMLTVDFNNDEPTASARLERAGSEINFRDCHVVWWRRPQPLTVHPELGDFEGRQFAFVEAHSAVLGLWMILDAFWINHPSRDEEAARKLYQLRIAREVGLRVPETCVTSNPAHARNFIRRRGPEHTVYKAFSGTERAWRETRVLKASELSLVDNVKYAPVIFQEYIPALADLRATVVGEEIFAARVYSQETDYKVDFRMTMDVARVEPTELPTDVTAALRALMNRLELVYGAIDMRVTPDGEYVFLEINPAGQWLFVEHRTGQPISDALANLMVARDATPLPRGE